MKNTKKQKGSIFKWVLLLGAVVLILSYFNFDLQTFMESDSVKNNFGFIWDFILNFWNNYLAEYFNIFWNYIKPMAGPAVDKIQESENILDLLENMEIPKSAVPEIPSLNIETLEA